MIKEYVLIFTFVNTLNNIIIICFIGKIRHFNKVRLKCIKIVIALKKDPFFHFYPSSIYLRKTSFAH